MSKIYINSNLEHPATELYALLAFDDTGNEGITSTQVDNQHFPLVSTNKEHAKFFAIKAKEIIKDCGQKLRLVKFTNKEILEEFV